MSSSCIDSPPITLQEYTPLSIPATPRIPLSRHAGPIPAITVDGDYDNFLAKAVTDGD